MDPHERITNPTNRGVGGFKMLAIVFTGVLTVIVLLGAWSTSKIGTNEGPPPTTSTPK